MMLSFLAAAALLPQASGPIDVGLAQRYFQEAKWISDDDGGKLWGRPLYGPMIFADPRTRYIVANEALPDPGFTATDKVFVGKLPDKFTIANTAFEWGGKRWTMVIWPPPSNRAERASLMMHELFHRIQPDLGLVGGSPQNSHLESLDGRLWLQLEMRALGEALSSKTRKDREKHAKAALTFRQARQKLFPSAKAEEDSLELNEGLSEFTGYMLRGGWEPESRLWMGNQLRTAIGKDAYSRSFAYTTGPAYAFLINVTEAVRFNEVRWRKSLNNASSLAGKLAELLNIRADFTNALAIEVAKGYGYDELWTAEEKRDKERKARIADIRKRWIDGPVLLLPLKSMRISFNPHDVFPLDAEGTFYPTAAITDEWGTIEVTGGILVASDFRSASVIADGPGWNLKLKDGWKQVPGKRKGDFTLVKD